MIISPPSANPANTRSPSSAFATPSTIHRPAVPRRQRFLPWLVNRVGGVFLSNSLPLLWRHGGSRLSLGDRCLAHVVLEPGFREKERNRHRLLSGVRESDANVPRDVYGRARAYRRLAVADRRCAGPAVDEDDFFRHKVPVGLYGTTRRQDFVTHHQVWRAAVLPIHLDDGGRGRIRRSRSRRRTAY